MNGYVVINIQCCGSPDPRIPDPDFYPSRVPDLVSRIQDLGSRIPDLGSRIPDQKTATKERGENKFVVIPFFVAKNFTKLKIIHFKMIKKKIWANFQRIIELFTQKIVTKLSKIRVWDPGSEIWDPEKTYSGSWNPDPRAIKALDPGSRTRIPDPGPGSAILH